MSGETQNAPVPEEEGVDEEQFDAEFNAGFSGKEAEKPTETPAATPEPTTAPAPAPEYVQVTKEDWESVRTRAAKVDEIEVSFGKMRDSAFGKIGGVERALAALQQGTAAGAAVTINDEDFAELKEAYPELADLTRKALVNVIGKMKGTGGAAVDPKALDERAQVIRKELSESSADTADVVLDNIVGGDWQEEVRTPKFGEWLNGQSAEVKALAASVKNRDAASLLRAFVAHRDQPAPTPAPSPAPAAPSPRQRQLAAAVPPKGDGGSPPGPTAEDEFEAGFKKHTQQMRR